MKFKNMRDVKRLGNPNRIYATVDAEETTGFLIWQKTKTKTMKVYSDTITGIFWRDLESGDLIGWNLDDLYSAYCAKEGLKKP